MLPYTIKHHSRLRLGLRRFNTLILERAYTPTYVILALTFTVANNKNNASSRTYSCTHWRNNDKSNHSLYGIDSYFFHRFVWFAPSSSSCLDTISTRYQRCSLLREGYPTEEGDSSLAISLKPSGDFRTVRQKHPHLCGLCPKISFQGTRA